MNNFERKINQRLVAIDKKLQGIEDINIQKEIQKQIKEIRNLWAINPQADQQKKYISIEQCKDFFNNKQKANYLKHSYLLSFLTAWYRGGILLLNGSVGVGKTHLIRNTTNYLTQEPHDSENVYIIPVRPAWLDPSDLLGFYDPINEIFRPSSFTTAIKNASKKSSELSIICLDELNLARIENYASDLLSKLEYKEPLNLYSGDIHQKLDQEKEQLEKEMRFQERSSNHSSQLNIGENIVFVGTLNSDETTYELSPKVIDRSFVISFPLPDFEPNNEIPSTDKKEWNFVSLQDWQKNIDDAINRQELDDNFWNEIQGWNKNLSGNEIMIPLGYRVQETYKAFMAIGELLGFDEDEILGHFLFTKIMPRIKFSKNTDSIRESKEEIFKKWIQSDIQRYHKFDSGNIIKRFERQLASSSILNIQYF